MLEIRSARIETGRQEPSVDQRAIGGTKYLSQLSLLREVQRQRHERGLDWPINLPGYVSGRRIDSRGDAAAFLYVVRWRRFAMKNVVRSFFVLAATVAVVLALAAGPSSAGGVTPDQLRNAGWTCVRPLADPTRLICASPGLGLPPLPGTPGFADRGPSYELMVFAFATGEFIGTQHLLRPDIYLRGTPPCPQQPGGEYSYIPRNDTWSCFRAK